MIEKLNRAGSYHHNSSEENQDAVLYGRNKRFEVITLADGVSSCERGKEGAWAACEIVTGLLLEKGDYFLNFEKETTADLVTSHILYELEKKAQQNKEAVDAYSSTLASVLFDKKTKKMLFFNLGDSLILATRGERCGILSVPYEGDGGCPVTTTRNVSLAVNTGVIDASMFDSVVICTDGAWQHMFERNRLTQDIQTMLAGQRYDELAQYLESQNGEDDYSFISIDLRKVHRRKAA